MIVQFETLEALRKSVLTKASGRLKKDPDLVGQIEDLVKTCKNEAQCEIEKLNKEIEKSRSKSSIKDLLGGKAKSNKSKARKKKDIKKKKKDRKDKKEKKKKPKKSSSSESDSTSTPSDDEDDSDQEEEEKKGSDDESESGSTHRTMSAATELLGEKPKKRRKTDPPKSVAGSLGRRITDDQDLWSNSKFTPETEKTKQSETVTDELMEMISDVLYANFKSSSESQFSFRKIEFFYGNQYVIIYTYHMYVLYTRWQHW